MYMYVFVSPYLPVWTSVGVKKEFIKFFTPRDPIKETSPLLITKSFHVPRLMFWFAIRRSLELLDIFVKIYDEFKSSFVSILSP